MVNIQKTGFRFGAVLLVLTFVGLSTATLASEDKSGRSKVLEMYKTDQAPVIDGVMDDIWENAPVIEALHQVSPIEYAEPSEKTVIRVMYDEDYLYVSGMMYHNDPSEIVANKLIPGSNLSQEDKLRVYINPFNDGRKGYLFQTNPNGV